MEKPGALILARMVSFLLQSSGWHCQLRVLHLDPEELSIENTGVNWQRRSAYPALTACQGFPL